MCEAEVRGPSGTRHLPCELIAVGIGARAELSLAQALDLSLDPEGLGLEVSARFETSAKGVYAAGVCAAAHASSGAHWPKGWVSAERQGRLAARAMLGLPLEERVLDRDPSLIPLISRFGRLTHTRVGALGSPLAQVWRHPKRPELLCLYEREGKLTDVSALGRPLKSADWWPLIAQGLPCPALNERPMSEGTRGLRRAL